MTTKYYFKIFSNLYFEIREGIDLFAFDTPLEYR